MTKWWRQSPLHRSVALDRADRKQWCDPPAFFGSWNTVFKRYRDWVKADIFIRLSRPAPNEPDHGRCHHRQGQLIRPGRK
ncbi:hypothetical protein EN851_22565 [Mesorhizobium sp. M8A.F.Ca.ET.208.01.1.1]|nr:hypothetical protein EN851_22565 [Mesorhizobium sp. M8A.F.Ca.ET.208.01.1.1]TGR32186.1 hypothetical protein EN845_06380 [Mesorhizobium sp. M8A.F.Ca.ET.202.01.1.1]TGT50401.1 hypothetical protein EN810_22465 [Mesorhizobium sp. M8A.F.Ca.ET.167.01.1.1]TGU40064.1 hypothetical protein EN799_06380 [bacterium M00.F.Ca.ET.156.01.1.1]